MADVFVSYSRHDGAFVRELHDVLIAAGRDVWVDWEDIPPASDWEQDIDDSIDAAESVVFVVSASSLASEYCTAELEHAQKRGKRVVPLAIDGADPAAAPTALRQLNWIWAREADDRAAAFAALERALDTDLEWSRAHTRLLVRAVEWDARRDASLLLRGKDLEQAEHELAANAGKDPRPTELQQRYLHESRRSTSRRQRLLLGGVTAALAVSVALGVVALLQRNTATERARVAESQTLSLRAVDALEAEPAAALGLAVDAYETSPTREARLALRRAILANPIELVIPAIKRLDATAEPTLAFGAGGTRLLGLTPSGRLRVWNASGRDVATKVAAEYAALGPGGRVLSAHLRRVRLARGASSTARYAAAGKRIAAVGFAGTTPLAVVTGGGAAALLNVATGRQVRLGTGPISVREAVFSGDGTRVVTPGRRTRVWSTRDGRLLAAFPDSTSAAISPDGRYVATVGDDGESLWSVAGAKRVARLDDTGAWPVFSPTGDVLAAVELDGAVKIWRTASGRLVGTLPGSGILAAGPGYTTSFDPDVAFSDGGRLLAVANNDGNVRVWELVTRTQVGSVRAGWANALAFAPDGSRLAMMTWDGDVVVARVPASTTITTGFRPVTGCYGAPPRTSPDGLLVAAPARGGAGIWRTDGSLVRLLRPPVATRFATTAGAIAFSADGTAVAVGAQLVQCDHVLGTDRFGSGVWRLGRPAPTLRVWEDAGVELDRNGRLLAAGGRAWLTGTGARVRGLDGVVALAPAAPRALVASGGTTRVVETPSGRTVSVLDDAGRLARGFGEISFASLSPEGDRVLTSNGGVLHLWNAGDGSEIARLDRLGEAARDYDFGDGGRRVNVLFDEQAAVFDASNGKLVFRRAGRFDAISDDGKFAITLGETGGLDAVQLDSGLPVALQPGTAAPLVSASFGPTAALIVAGDENGDVHVIRCAVCAADDELLRDARARLAVVARQPTRPPITGAIA